jgi:hypothetical protein
VTDTKTREVLLTYSVKNGNVPDGGCESIDLNGMHSSNALMSRRKDWIVPSGRLEQSSCEGLLGRLQLPPSVKWNGMYCVLTRVQLSRWVLQGRLRRTEYCLTSLHLNHWFDFAQTWQVSSWLYQAGICC